MSKYSSRLFAHDTLLILIMGVLAACGLIYEYLLSHYAGRVLGTIETAIYSMIGLMIVSMGIGAFAARWIRNPFTGFVTLEILIALLGSTSILIIAVLIAVSYELPELITEMLSLTEPLAANGPLFTWFKTVATNMPYVMGFILGCMIGMEIPLIARVREKVHGEHLENNAGTIYGADYIGAGMGAAMWVTVMLSMDITHAAMLTALFNLVSGAIFLWVYRKRISYKPLLWLLHVLLIFMVLSFWHASKGWLSDLNNVLYKDKVVYTQQTPYQNITVTQRKIAASQDSIYDLYLNGRLQFSSSDEHIYHSMLVYPAMAASARHDNILIIGGGDGFAVRNVLRWHPQRVTLVDLDRDMVNLFANGRYQSQEPVSGESKAKQQEIMALMAELNHQAFSDPKVDVIFGDAFIEIKQLLDEGRHFDTIIIDLPDPSHPDLNKLYSDLFYARVSQLLYGDGVLVVQSTSPFHAKKAFVSIGKTVEAAGFNYVEQYHQNVPSFGEWGWTIATKRGASAKTRLQKLKQLPVADSYITLGVLFGAFEFPAYYWEDTEAIQINEIGSNRAYNYHYKAWNQDEEALFLNKENAFKTKNTRDKQ